MRANRGFTLVEALVALAVFAIGILGLIASVTSHSRSGLDSRLRTEAAAAADELIALIQTAAPATREVDYATGGAALNAWLAARLQAPRTGLPGGEATVDFGAVGGDTRTVQIEIRWTQPREAGRDGTGTKTAELVNHRYRTVAAIVR
ncbi:MAG: prepilin-type N-terminal cleavage/methylation domain-containing protein [Lautropia sp.]